MNQVVFGFVGWVVFLAGVAGLQSLLNETVSGPLTGPAQALRDFQLSFQWWIVWFDFAVLVAFAVLLLNEKWLEWQRLRLAVFTLVVSSLYMMVLPGIINQVDAANVASLTSEESTFYRTAAAGGIMRVICQYVTAIVFLWGENNGKLVNGSN